MITREKVNILLVDDQPAKLLSLATIVSSLDETLVTTSSADEALKYLLDHDCAVVLMDVCMPKMDGFELAEMIRQHPRFDRTAIIFISAVHLSDADRLRGYNLGAVDYIPVPIVPEVLRAKVAVFVDLFRKTRDLERVNDELQERILEVNRSNGRLRFADRMATIGTLAAGLGHDMGNLLLPVRMRLDTLEAMDLPDPARADIAAIREASSYLQRLASSLRLLALDSDAEVPSECSTRVGDWWSETESMMRNGVPRRVQLSTDIPSDLRPVRMGKAGLTQVVFNLVQNAGDALRDRSDGTIVVSARDDPGRGTVLITVFDNGPGMTEEAKARCLEPFFTTKTRGLSTGLGLTLVSALMKRVQGTICIDSEAGIGTRIVLELPAAKAADTARPDGSPMRVIASVTLKDVRLAAHVRSILDSLEYDVTTGDRNGADLWITEADGNGEIEAARRFAASGPVRRAVVLGTSPLTPGDHDRVVYLDRALKASALRAQLRDALRANGRGAGVHR